MSGWRKALFGNIVTPVGFSPRHEVVIAAQEVLS